MNLKNINITALSLYLLLSAAGALDARASEQVYQGQNPAIFAGANPANAGVLLEGVVKPNNPNAAASTAGLTASSVVEQSVLAQASQQINNQIFNSTPGQSGTFQLGDGSSISYQNVLGVISLTVTDSHGVTTIGGF